MLTKFKHRIGCHDAALYVVRPKFWECVPPKTDWRMTDGIMRALSTSKLWLWVEPNLMTPLGRRKPETFTECFAKP